MTHDTVNTLGGKFGFVAEYADGTRHTELDRLWDEVEGNLISLSLYNFATQTRLVELRGYEKFFFANECVSTKLGTVPLLSAKMIGGVNGGQAVECRVDLLGPEPKGSKREMSLEQVPYNAASFRKGVT